MQTIKNSHIIVLADLTDAYVHLTHVLNSKFLCFHFSSSPPLSIPLYPSFFPPLQTDRRWLSPSVKAMPLPS